MLGISPDAVMPHNFRGLIARAFAASKGVSSRAGFVGVLRMIATPLPRLGSLGGQSLLHGLGIEQIAIVGFQTGNLAGIGLTSQPLLRDAQPPRHSRKR